MLLFKDIIYLIIGCEFIEGKTIISYVLLSSILQSFLETTVYGIYIEKKVYISTILLAFQLVSNVVLSLIMTPIWGIRGAAIAMLISNVIYFTLSTYWGQKYYKSIKSAFLTALSILVLLAESVAINMTDHLVLAIVITIVPVITLILMYWDDLKTIKILNIARIFSK